MTMCDHHEPVIEKQREASRTSFHCIIFAVSPCSKFIQGAMKCGACAGMNMCGICCFLVSYYLNNRLGQSRYWCFLQTAHGRVLKRTFLVVTLSLMVRLLKTLFSLFAAEKNVLERSCKDHWCL
ncbi:hypothetical protein BDN67DRAFT_784031 [Paxillus ammoniavirescens]|nr:hypothetical protein BDN67DRAFT_784031 [Paxillus ammoniavirescens]